MIKQKVKLRTYRACPGRHGPGRAKNSGLGLARARPGPSIIGPVDRPADENQRGSMRKTLNTVPRVIYH